MSAERKNYETTYIVNASMEDAQIESTISHVAEVIERNGGSITATNRWGRKRMAYAIEKKNNGFYVNLEFTGPGALINQLERAYILDENILRFLTIQLDKRALQAKEKAGADRAAEAAPAAAAAAPAPPAAEPAPKTEPSKEPEARKPLFGDEEEEKAAR